MLNIVALQGRLAADPEQRTTQNGTAVTSFSLAVQRNVKGSDGEYGTDWIDCVAWRNTAEFIGKYFTKGKMIALDGTLQTRSYEKGGVKHKVTEVVVQSVYFCESRKVQDAQHREPAASSVLPDTPPLSQDEMEEILGADDLPF